MRCPAANIYAFAYANATDAIFVARRFREKAIAKCVPRSSLTQSFFLGIRQLKNEDDFDGFVADNLEMILSVGKTKVIAGLQIIALIGNNDFTPTD
jgi:hypothetical protein